MFYYFSLLLLISLNLNTLLQILLYLFHLQHNILNLYSLTKILICLVHNVLHPLLLLLHILLGLLLHLTHILLLHLILLYYVLCICIFGSVLLYILYLLLHHIYMLSLFRPLLLLLPNINSEDILHLHLFLLNFLVSLFHISLHNHDLPHLYLLHIAPNI